MIFYQRNLENFKSLSGMRQMVESCVDMYSPGILHGICDNAVTYHFPREVSACLPVQQ